MLGGQAAVEELSLLADFSDLELSTDFKVTEKAASWASWWTTGRRLVALSAAFHEDDFQWSLGPRDTNAIESLNRQQKRGIEPNTGIKSVVKGDLPLRPQARRRCRYGNRRLPV